MSREWTQRAEEELEALALEGLNSGESIEADEKYWEEKRRRLMERHGPRSQVASSTRAKSAVPPRAAGSGKRHSK
jgi:hypothetical protein